MLSTSRDGSLRRSPAAIRTSRISASPAGPTSAATAAIRLSATRIPSAPKINSPARPGSGRAR